MYVLIVATEKKESNLIFLVDKQRIKMTKGDFAGSELIPEKSGRKTTKILNRRRNKINQFVTMKRK